MKELLVIFISFVTLSEVFGQQNFKHAPVEIGSGSGTGGIKPIITTPRDFSEAISVGSSIGSGSCGDFTVAQIKPKNRYIAIITQCGNFIIFLSRRFYMKSILGILEV